MPPVKNKLSLDDLVAQSLAKLPAGVKPEHKDLRARMVRGAHLLWTKHKGKLGLYLSGGLDSTCELLAMLEAGAKPFGVTFYLQGEESPDLIAARRLKDTFGIRVIEVEVPRGERELVRDVFFLIHYLNVPTKAEIQVSHPFTYSLTAIPPDTKAMLTGLMSDLLIGNNRELAFKAHRGGRAGFDEARRSGIADWENTTSGCIESVIRDRFEAEDLFRDEKVQEWFLGRDIKELISPQPKYPLLMAFSDYFKAYPIARHSAPLQVAGGFRAYHDLLLYSKWNVSKHSSVVGVYNFMQKVYDDYANEHKLTGDEAFDVEASGLIDLDVQDWIKKHLAPPKAAKAAKAPVSPVSSKFKIIPSRKKTRH